jgi:hypothetical protein
MFDPPQGGLNRVFPLETIAFTEDNDFATLANFNCDTPFRSRLVPCDAFQARWNLNRESFSKVAVRADYHAWVVLPISVANQKQQA